ncbi:glutathione S-transferase family protein [Parendozoicomonas sp. Alg238-R29]|uniref:glutathione S-transferase family protein n=1 Tax=Parendozoicomonas sp. Alg238-R29 TaxID=2993446 RepID=UPI00248ED6D1|nr:glutathione S-transferase family protein [Parendozoicomonas sp. Alg238-R29]
MPNNNASNLSDTYKHYGWTVSPYSQKTLAYLKYKQIPFEDQAPSVLKLIGDIRFRVGKAIMPTMQTPNGEWLQDSSEIIDILEKRFAENPVFPTTPKQRIAANLLELHGDEWLVMSALHYRWRTPENYRFAVNEFARNAWPWGPSWLAKLIGIRIGQMMRAYMKPSRFGMDGKAAIGLEKHTIHLIELLEIHFTEHDFLLGSKPCIGDFSLFGPLWAHLYRDPGTTHLYDDKPNVRAWFERLLNPEQQNEGEYLSDDVVPVTLEPILKLILEEQFEFCRSVLKTVEAYIQSNPSRSRIPRILGRGPYVIGGEQGKRGRFSYVQWMTQRSLDAWQQVPPEQKEDVVKWLTRLGGENFMNTTIQHRMVRQNFKEILA